jgi:hypothetical protein
MEPPDPSPAADPASAKASFLGKRAGAAAREIARGEDPVKIFAARRRPMLRAAEPWLEGEFVVVHERQGDARDTR